MRTEFCGSVSNQNQKVQTKRLYIVSGYLLAREGSFRRQRIGQSDHSCRIYQVQRT
jgi:hypothetical protein